MAVTLIFAGLGFNVIVFPGVSTAIAGLQVVLVDETLNICIAACEVDLGRDDWVQPALDDAPDS